MRDNNLPEKKVETLYRRPTIVTCNKDPDDGAVRRGVFPAVGRMSRRC